VCPRQAMLAAARQGAGLPLADSVVPAEPLPRHAAAVRHEERVRQVDDSGLDGHSSMPARRYRCWYQPLTRQPISSTATPAAATAAQ
jgi:hypothetical protein